MPSARRLAFLAAASIGGAVDQTGWRPGNLDATHLLRRARSIAGYSQWIGEAPDEALERLVYDLRRHANLHLPGRMAARFDMLRLLVNRLRIDAAFRSDPTLTRELVDRPIFVVGLPRTGTTAVHGLLAADPAHRAPKTWETLYPIPEGDMLELDAAARRKRTAAQLPWMEAMSPGFLARHPLDSEDPQECIAITAHTFESYQFQSMYRIPEYQRWLESRARAPAYAFHKRFLQYLQRQDRVAGRDRPRRWVLKAPAHLLGLESLFETYPDASVVQTHRAPTEIVSSLASLTVHTRAAFSRRTDPNEVGREMLLRWSDAMQRAVSARDQMDDGSRRFVDLRYVDLIENPSAAMRSIYTNLRLLWTGSTEKAIDDVRASHPQNRHGVHGHRIDEYGISSSEVDTLFAGYRARFLLDNR